MRNSIFHEPEIELSLSDAWKQLQVSLIAPIIYIALIVYAFMSLALFLERVYMTIMILCLKAFGKKPDTKYKLPAVREIMEQNKQHPRVLVQIPIYNGSEVYKLSIGAACALKWPRERLIVQVLDNSTNIAKKANVKIECRKWQIQGVNIKYENRAYRNGYRRGALREGLQKQYVNDCEHVVIFNADFRPRNDFLTKTIPYLMENKDLGMVQAKWISADEYLISRLQEITLNYYFSVEQERGSSCQPFGIDGSIGVWLIQAIIDAGGWKERTTVDDMDLEVRSSLQGWKFVSIGEVCRSGP